MLETIRVQFLTNSVDLSITQYNCVFARWRHSAMKFLNKKLMTVFSILILQKFTNFHAILSWSFQNICNEIG